ncbi:hypothetical protein GCM10025877_33560 [Agromyces mangrovi Wang et al. 2018]|nr:hypothetical protein GCM10025877_33560 [Agromyces mangrovi]
MLPHTWNAVDGQAGGEYHRGRTTYAHRIEAEVADGETWVEFAGVNSSAEVYLDGRLLARHDGGYSTFRADLTDGLVAGAGAGTLLVIVDNAANERVYPQQADFTFYGGIYREVRLISVGRDHFALDDHGGPGLSATPTLHGTRADVALHAGVAGVTPATAVRFTIDGEGGATVAVRDGRAQASVRIEDVRRWHGLRDPHLYTARAELLDGDTVLDAVELRFGCREFAVDPERGFLLNGEAYPFAASPDTRTSPASATPSPRRCGGRTSRCCARSGRPPCASRTTNTTNCSTTCAMRRVSSCGPRSRRSPCSSPARPTTHATS